MAKITEAQHQEKAVFVGVIKQNDDERQVMEYLDELEFLAETAGAIGVKKFIQKVDRPDSRTYIRSGKLQEIREYIEENEIEVVIFDDELSPTQLRNIERELNIRILDRTPDSEQASSRFWHELQTAGQFSLLRLYSRPRYR